MKYLITIIIGIGLVIIAVENYRSAKWREDMIHDFRICSYCPQNAGPGMSTFWEYGDQGDTVIIFQNRQPVLYTDSTSTWRPLMPGRVPVSDYAIWQGREVYVEAVSMDGKAVILINDNKKIVNYYDLQPATNE